VKDHSDIPTLREIAHRAGVSAMTVSRALKNHPKQSRATNKRIRELARQMGWKPNPLVSALMGQRVRQHGTRSSANLAILDPRSDDPAANADYIRGAKQRAADHGYALDFFSYQPSQISPAKLRTILEARGIRGLILMPLPVGVDQVDFDFAGFAASTIGFSVQSPVLPRVANDTQSAVFDSLHRLEHLGYTRVGLIMARDANRRTLYLTSGARTAYQSFLARSLKISELILPNEKFDVSQQEKIVAWIARHRIDVVISSAGDLYEKIIQPRLTPDQVAYLHLHRHSMPHVSSMDQMRAYQGSKAVDLITAMIQRNESLPVEFPQTTLTPSVWREGETTPARVPVSA
jgi:DNA-binding LacI/PurR family transcriptional regulator